MAFKQITLKTSPNKILELFREAGVHDRINLKTPKGFIYLAGGILSKLEGDKLYMAVGGRWVGV